MPVTFTDADIEAIRRELPELPEAMRTRFRGYGLTEYDAEVLTGDRALAVYFDAAVKAAKNPKAVANWITGELLRLLGEAGCAVGDCPVAPAALARLTDLIESGRISGKIGKDVLAAMFETGAKPERIIEERGLVQVSDEGAIAGVVAEAIAANPNQVEEFKAGNGKVLQYLVGQVMKLSRGRANPPLVGPSSKSVGS